MFHRGLTNWVYLKDGLVYIEKRYVCTPTLAITCILRANSEQVLSHFVIHAEHSFDCLLLVQGLILNTKTDSQQMYEIKCIDSY